MSIAIVILNWNGLELLKTYLPSVVEHSSDEASIYILDNASSDGSVNFVKDNYPELKCIVNKENKGYAGGYNEGLKSVDEDILILLNNDVKVTENWLLPLKKTFASQNDVAVIQPKILDVKKPQYFEYAGAAGGFLDFFGYPFCRGRLFAELEKDNGQYDNDTQILWASGACLAIRKEVFECFGGFDETYFAHQEEIDLCWRIHNSGRKVWYCHNSVVYHLGGGTLNTQHPRKTFYNFRNSLFNIVKNVSFPSYLLIILARLILDGLACIRFLFSGQIKHIMAVLKAHFSFYRYFFVMLKKRDPSIGFKKYYSIKSIIVQHFLWGKKTFESFNSRTKI